MHQHLEHGKVSDRPKLIGECLAPTIALIAAPDRSVAGVTRRLDRLVVYESVLGIAIRCMSGMARDARSGIGIGCLPAGQELVPVTVPALALSLARSPTRNGDLLFGGKATLGHRLVTFETALIANRKVHDGWLDGCPRKPLEGVPGAH